eukprot:741532-Pyramimonas_sp.AAC.1
MLAFLGHLRDLCRPRGLLHYFRTQNGIPGKVPPRSFGDFRKGACCQARPLFASFAVGWTRPQQGAPAAEHCAPL